MTNTETGRAIMASNPTEPEIRVALMMIAGSHTQKAQDELIIAQYYQDRHAA